MKSIRQSLDDAEPVRTLLPSVRGRPLRRMPDRLYGYVWRSSARQQVRLCLLTCLVFPLSMAPLEFQRRIVDNAIEGEDLSLLLWLGAGYLAVALVHGALKYVRNVYQGRVSEGIIRLLRRRLLRLTEAEQNAAEGARVSMIAAEAERLGNFAGEALAFPLLQGGILVSVMGYMLVVEPLIAGVAFMFFLPSIILAPILQQRINRYAARRTEMVRELGDGMVDDEKDGSQGAGRASREHRDDLVQRIYDLRLHIFVLKYLVKFVNNLTGHLGPISVLVVGGWMAIEGRTEVGVVVAFISGYERITDPSRELLNFYRRLSEMRVQYRLVADAARRIEV